MLQPMAPAPMMTTSAVRGCMMFLLTMVLDHGNGGRIISASSGEPILEAVPQR